MDNTGVQVSFRKEMQKELLRKALHILICFLPLLARMSKTISVLLLLSGLLVYTVAELTRIYWNGHNGFFPYVLIKEISLYASRTGEEKGFIKGPVTLAVGSLVTLLLFPQQPMTCGIFALAFGDTAASISGKVYARNRIDSATRNRKTIVGSVVCFLVSGCIIWQVTDNFPVSMIAGITSAVCESITIKDMDNILIPIGVATVVYFL